MYKQGERTKGQMNNNFLQCKALVAGMLLLSLCVACGRSEKPRQEAYTEPYHGENRARHEEHRRMNTEAKPGDFDYYVLSLSWAPAFCEDLRHRAMRECDPQRNTGFVVHGLWPERENGRSPDSCGNTQSLDETAVQEALSVMPDVGLVRHEWRAHGTCSALSPQQYFGLLTKAREKVEVPAPYRSPQRGLRTSAFTVEQRFAQASKITQRGAIHVHCVGNQLAEVRFCLTKSLDPRPCSENVGECRANPIFMRSVR